MAQQFPSMRGKQLLRKLAAAPLSYQPPSTGTSGSHTKLVSQNGYPALLLAFHDSQELAPGLIRKILVKDVGLTVEEALDILRG